MQVEQQLESKWSNNISGRLTIEFLEIRTECIKQKVSFDIVRNHIVIPGNNAGLVSDEMINIIYNSCNVGINTCIGEGFGLCCVEHAYLKHPQIVAGVGALVDIFTNDYSRVITPVATISVTNLLDGHAGDISFCNQNDYVKAMKYYYENEDEEKKHGEIASAHIDKKYDWDIICKEFARTLI